MDLEAIPIQIQTPSKEDEDETLPELNEPLESIMTEDHIAVEFKGDEEEKPDDVTEEETPAEPMDQDIRDDEIVVGDVNDELAQQNGHHTRHSSLSSAPGSEAGDADDANPGSHPPGNSHSNRRCSHCRHGKAQA